MKNDVTDSTFEQESIESLRSQLLDMETTIINQQAMIDYYAQHREELMAYNDYLNGQYYHMKAMEQSNAWRLALKIMSFSRKVFPPGAPHTRAAKSLYKKIRRFFAAHHDDTAEPDLQSPATILPEMMPGKAKLTRFALPVVENPVISIIIPAYNQFEYTYLCIKSICDNAGGLPYEVILADDNSSDKTKGISGWIDNLVIVRNAENLRFLLNCNNAAKYAKGKYLVFLNNDTQVCHGWLSSLYQMMESDDKIGIAGSKLIYPDGRLQEAGGIIWNDASGWNFGRGEDPGGCEYNYVKEVDYISGASIMVRKDLWDTVGGFDERYAPAYYEDTDLAFEARKHGYKVMYQPLSEVIHFEGITNGTDLNSGQKQYQTENKEKFLNKWHDVLQKENFPDGMCLLRARDRSKNKKIILVLDHYIPTFDKDAGSRSIYNYMRLFVKKGWKVIFMPDNFSHTEYAEHYQQMGIEILYGHNYRKGWEEWVRKNGSEFEAILLHRPHISVKYIDFFNKNTTAKIIYYGADLHFLREERQYLVEHDENLLDSAKSWKKLEFALMRQADCSLYPSYVEEEHIKNIDASLPVLTVPLYVFNDLPSSTYNASARKDLLFVGGFNHPPNVDAVNWLAEEIMPAVWKENPNLVLHVVGSNPTPEIMELASPNIIVHGFVSDEELMSLMHTCRLSVVPLRYGAGLKGKVIEAMAQGAPVVTTPIGAEGIKNASDYMIVQETANGLAGEICRLYNNSDELSRLSQKSLEYIKNTFSEKAAIEVFEQAIGEL